jgi:hypothetical protein
VQVVAAIPKIFWKSGLTFPIAVSSAFPSGDGSELFQPIPSLIPPGAIVGELFPK